MKLFSPVTLAALLLGTLLGFGPAPASAAQGCGPGFHRNVYGVCRPNYGGYYGAPGVYRGGVYRGGVYRGGVYGRRVYGGRVYGHRGYAGRGYGARVGHYGARGFGGRRGRR
ncbi:GCG_CRPN prefix-to-repeats domain-containing protein [Methylobacterium sp. WSM2598]|uniref:GCG_CRPN prefix-to-repeats domain-containing protein n=1 Tax=Methylobacterium sp. WSM2598 TaxID=398261 RepID=UPI00037C6042|nr:hypothetical protein [Methylobacterium sp. WSM2598]